LHLVGFLYYCVNDARSHKHQIYNLAVYTDPSLDTFSMNRDYKRKSFSFRDRMLFLGGYFHCLVVEFQEICYWEVERPTINIVPWANRWTDLQHLLINTVELRVVYLKHPLRTENLSQLIIIEKSVMKRRFFIKSPLTIHRIKIIVLGSVSND